jgi:hypothetical protein
MRRGTGYYRAIIGQRASRKFSAGGQRQRSSLIGSSVVDGSITGPEEALARSRRLCRLLCAPMLNGADVNS